MLGYFLKQVHVGGHLETKNFFVILTIFTSNWNNPTRIYLSEVDDRNTRTKREICSKLTIKTPERRQWHRSGVFIVNFKHLSHFVLVFLLLALNM